MKTGTRVGITCPRCYRRHQSWDRLARCRWRRATWVAGNPPVDGPCWALVSFCWHQGEPGPTVTLWDDRNALLKQKQLIDRLGCGGSCWRRHYTYALHEWVDEVAD